MFWSGMLLLSYMTDIESHTKIKSNLTTHCKKKKKKKKNPGLPTQSLNIWVGNCKQTIFKDGPISQAHSLIHLLKYSLTLSIE